MAQFDFGQIDPSQLSGIELADLLNAFRTAVLSGHSGDDRPYYAPTNLVWVDTSGSVPVVRFYNGVSDQKLLDVLTAKVGLSLLGMNDHVGLLLGEIGAGDGSSARLTFDGGSKTWMVYNHDNELLFAYEAEPGANSGTAKIRFRGSGVIEAPDADGPTITGPGDLPNRGYNDARYLQDTRQGAEVTSLFGGAVADQSWFRAAAGSYVSGVRIGVEAGDERVTGIAYRPLQKFIDGAWVTVTAQ
ncbi:hypothetical protein RSK20926_11834 [Roseobacter sp. SK209-2-6]|uniref:hypothetical protein n=1 Tax=Roseobacter sp. SK209-2-6 TaxID=388739 RepID=UPI0000F3C5D9|nr:hypothetical protein [Roseobacter sp. SK209-2-6]EBA18408.1 hypothetical protein RSK20926_11834 [Roseobacter sp. SK209-2-6]